MMRLPVRVRAATRRDLLTLERAFPYGPPERHAECLRWQRQGYHVYLIAWSEDQPVGHVVLKWSGGDGGELSMGFLGAWPEVEDLFVLEPYRSRGVGTQLLEASESLAREKGHDGILLAVSRQNHRARRLYERLGFKDIGLVPHVARGTYRDENGRTLSWREMRIYLIKRFDDV